MENALMEVVFAILDGLEVRVILTVVQTIAVGMENAFLESANATLDGRDLKIALCLNLVPWNVFKLLEEESAMSLQRSVFVTQGMVVLVVKNDSAPTIVLETENVFLVNVFVSLDSEVLTAVKSNLVRVNFQT